MRVFSGLRRLGWGAALAALALFIYVAAPLLHGLVHADHEIVAALKAPAGNTGDTGKSPAHDPGDHDCDLFKLYAGHAGHALAPTMAVAPAIILLAAQDAVFRLDPLPAGAPRGFALGRGPPHLS